MSDPRTVLEGALASPVGEPASDPDAVVAALDNLLRRGDVATALGFVGRLTMFWQNAGRVDDGRAVTERALAAGRAVEEPGAASALGQALLAASELAFRQGDQAIAEGRAREAIAVGTAAGDPPVVALAHVNLARIAYRDGDAPRIEAESQAALAAAPGNVAARRGALHMLAWAAHTRGDRPEARRRFEASLAYRQEHADELSVAVEVANLADMDAEDGDYAAAGRRLTEVLRTAERLGSVYLIVNTLPSIAFAAASTGRDADAARLLGAMDGVAASSGLAPDPGNWDLEAARTRLGSDYARLRAEGEALSRTEAVNMGITVAEQLGAG